MIQSRKLVAAAILFGLALIAAGLLIAPFNASARAAAGHQAEDVVADRIGGAFAASAVADAGPALKAAASRVAKGDLELRASCAKAVWPNIDSVCLSTASGAAARHVRMITIGYQVDRNTTVLVRLPESGVATR